MSRPCVRRQQLHLKLPGRTREFLVLIAQHLQQRRTLNTDSRYDTLHLFAITMNGPIVDLREELLRCGRRWEEDYTPQSPKDKLLYHVRRCWAEFCDDSSISDPVTGFKSYSRHETRFLEYLKKRDSYDDTTLGCYRRFFTYLAEKDLGDVPDEELASPLGQLLDELQAVADTTQRVMGRGV